MVGSGRGPLLAKSWPIANSWGEKWGKYVFTIEPSRDIRKIGYVEVSIVSAKTSGEVELKTRLFFAVYLTCKLLVFLSAY